MVAYNFQSTQLEKELYILWYKFVLEHCGANLFVRLYHTSVGDWNLYIFDLIIVIQLLVSPLFSPYVTSE